MLHAYHFLHFFLFVSVHAVVDVTYYTRGIPSWFSSEILMFFLDIFILMHSIKGNSLDAHFCHKFVFMCKSVHLSINRTQSLARIFMDFGFRFQYLNDINNRLINQERTATPSLCIQFEISSMHETSPRLQSKYIVFEMPKRRWPWRCRSFISKNFELSC